MDFGLMCVAFSFFFSSLAFAAAWVDRMEERTKQIERVCETIEAILLPDEEGTE